MKAQDHIAAVNNSAKRVESLGAGARNVIVEWLEAIQSSLKDDVVSISPDKFPTYQGRMQEVKDLINKLNNMGANR
jgi:hypothetical protein